MYQIGSGPDSDFRGIARHRRLSKPAINLKRAKSG
jgi:hypothetical protein